MRIQFIQNIIDSLRNKTWGMGTLVNKYLGIEKKPNIKTLILGSSHLMSGYLPNQDEYNLAFNSQDLYYSYKLYNKYNNNNIKNIIISFSVFTAGQKLGLGSEADACAILKIIYNIDYQYPEIAKAKKLHKKEVFYQKAYEKYLKIVNLPKNYRGEISSSKKKNIREKDIKIRALKHLKNNLRENNNLEYCTKLINATKENNQNLIFIIPPATTIYKSVLPSSEEIFNQFYKITQNNEHIKIINLYDSNQFNDSDFYDGDHLNNTGAKKLTKIIHDKCNL